MLIRIYLCISSGAAVKHSSVLLSRQQQCWDACERFNQQQQQQQTISLNVFSDRGKGNGVKQGLRRVYKNSIKVAVHQTSLANHSDFTCCFSLLLERHRLGLRLPLHLLAQNECVYTCVCMKECLCIGTMFCNTHAEGQQGINGANLGSLERGLYSEQHSTHSTENHSCNVTFVIYCLSFS